MDTLGRQHLKQVSHITIHFEDGTTHTPDEADEIKFSCGCHFGCYEEEVVAIERNARAGQG